MCFFDKKSNTYSKNAESNKNFIGPVYRKISSSAFCCSIMVYQESIIPFFGNHLFTFLKFLLKPKKNYI